MAEMYPKDKIMLLKHSLAQYVGILQFDPKQPGQIVVAEGCLLSIQKGSPARGQAGQILFSMTKLKTPVIVNGSSIVQELEEDGELYKKYKEVMTGIIIPPTGKIPRIH